MPLRSRMSTLFAALVVVAGSVFLFEYVLFVGHAVDGRLRRRGDPPIPVLQPITEKHDETNLRLGVVVPAYSGDLNKALNSLKYWPTTCYQSTLRKMDLILYYAGGAEDEVENVLPGLAETGGRCFANTRLVLGNLTAEVSLLIVFSWHGRQRVRSELHLSSFSTAVLLQQYSSTVVSTQLWCLVV